jgi:hypothetical protein
MRTLYVLIVMVVVELTSTAAGNGFKRSGGGMRYVCSRNKTHGRPTSEIPLWNSTLYSKNTLPQIEAGGDRTGIVFFHISKCGGTLMCALAKNATVRRPPARNCQLTGGGDLLVINQRQVIYNYDTLEVAYTPNTSICQHMMRNQYRAAYVNSLKGGLEYMTFESGVQGQVRARLAISVQPHLYFVTMLRDPLRHSLSAYSFFNRRNRPFLGWFAAQGHMFIDEIYVRTFSDAQLGANVTAADLERAIDTLNRLNLVLLLPENNSCSNFVDVLCKRLAWSYYCEPREIKHVNVGEVALPLSANETEFIRQKVRWDDRLYKHAVSVSPCISGDHGGRVDDRLQTTRN